MQIEEIMEYLPHRYPFLLIDRIVELEKGKAISGYKNVTMNEDFFNGHFPGKPIMPGVMIVEAMAQLSGVLGFVTDGTRHSDGIVHYLAGANNVRFKRPVVPGDQLRMEATLLSCKHNIWKFQCRALVGDEVACVAEIMTAKREV